MIEKELRDGLRGAVSDEPPLGFDPDEAVTKIGVRVRRRRATFAVAAAVIAVVGGAVAVQQSVGLGRSGEVEIATRPSSSTTTPSKPGFAWPIPGLVPPKRLSQAEADAKGRTLRDVVVPKFLGQVKGMSNVKAMPFDSTTAGPDDPGPNVLEGGVAFRDQEGDTAVFVSVYSARYAFHSPDEECADDPQSSVRNTICRVGKLADGTALVFNEAVGKEDPGNVIASALHYRLDGVVVRVTAYNYNPTGKGTPLQSRRARTTMTEQQLTAMATDRAFTM
ncbi:hypothetical protein [Allokutzneria sp. NRRL B-24872]|uniref:hypothetical protein n=1 Tax=Allokutzneria sp. NRRL B-24872 TaxID=1137961 RepID=UPI000A3C6A2D|nr:hypothetical protein [Allokutzneria sp. NRRL B-24872]